MTAVVNHYHGSADGLSNPKSRRSYVEPSHDSGAADFGRSASYTFLGNAATITTAYNAPLLEPTTVKGSFSEQDLIAHFDDSTDTSPPESSGWTTPADDQKLPVGLPQDLVAELHKSPKITVTANSEHDSSPPMSLKDGTSSIDSAKVLPASAVNDRFRSKSLAKRLSRRLSSTPPSRSPSPAKRDRVPPPDSAVQEASQDSSATPTPVERPVVARRKSIFRRRDSEKDKAKEKESADSTSSGGFLARKGTVLKRRSLKPVAPTVRASMEEPARSVPPTPQLPKSFSTDKLHTSSQLHHDRPAPMPPLISGEKFQTLPALTLPRKKDELWSVFRSLDGDYTK